MVTIDGCIEMVDSLPRFNFSWEGNEGMNDANGRGWMVRKGNQVTSHIYIYMDEESAFRAKYKMMNNYTLLALKIPV